MTVDDIYNAAVAGDTYQLRQLLDDGGSAILTEVIDCEETDYTCQFNVVFSILAQTQDNIDYEVLDILTEYGASFNDKVEVRQNDGIIKRRPMLEYALSVWENPQLTEYMLQKGALPNAVNKQTDARGRTTSTSMIWYALNAKKNAQLLELLLSYGADPEQCCRVYVEEWGVYQYLPPLYYSLVENGDYQNTVRLIRYGASPQCGIDVGVGFQHNTNFKKYLTLNHPNLSSLLVQAFNAAQKDPAPRVVHSRPPTQPAYEEPQPGHLNAGSKVTSMKRCYNKLTAYSFANFSILALGFCVIGPMVMAGENADAIPGLMMIGLPCLLLAAAMFSSVKRKAQKRGQDGVMGQFVVDSILVFVRVFLMMTVILVPFAKAIGSNIEWEDRKTTDGRSVTVKRTGDGTYEDTSGQIYRVRD